MSEQHGRPYLISEVSNMTKIPVHVLRQWESRFSQLKPKRDRANRRWYTPEDIEIVRRIKQLLWHEKLTTKGAQKRLGLEVHLGRPLTNREVIDLLDKIETEVRAMLNSLEPD